MTKDEAIKRILDHISVHKIGEYPHIKLTEALYMAISALRDQENEPLMREELLKMDGQPVWIEFIPDPDGQVKIWALVSADPEDDEIFLRNSLGGSSAYEEVSSDIRAIYRRPPKEG